MKSSPIPIVNKILLICATALPGVSRLIYLQMHDNYSNPRFLSIATYSFPPEFWAFAWCLTLFPVLICCLFFFRKKIFRKRA